MKSKKKKSKLQSFITAIFLFSHIVVLTAFVFSLLAGIVPTDQFWIFSFFGLVYLPLYLANVGFTALWVIMRRRYWMISVIPLVLGFMIVRGHFNLSLSNDYAKKPDDFKVMTFNVRDFQSTDGMHRDELKHQSFGLIENQHPDILCMQDFSLPFKGIYSVASLQLKLGLPYSACRNYVIYSDNVSVSGVAILSKFPIIRSNSVEVDSGYTCVSTDVLFREHLIRIISVHLQSYALFSEEKVLLSAPRSFGRFDEQRIKRDSRKIAWKLRWALRQRAPEARKLADYVQKSPYPVILCGDFNDTPASYVFRTISKTLEDPFPSLGSGIAKTYNESRYPFRIDYILHDKKFKSLDYHIIPTHLSDHNPVTAMMRFEQP